MSTACELPDLGFGEELLLLPCHPSSCRFHPHPHLEATSGNPASLGFFLALTRSTFCVSAGPGGGEGG